MGCECEEEEADDDRENAFHDAKIKMVLHYSDKWYGYIVSKLYLARLPSVSNLVLFT